MKARAVITVLLTFCCALTLHAQDGRLDTVFNHDGVTFHPICNSSADHPSQVKSMLVMPDSTIVLGCQSTPTTTFYQKGYGYMLSRLNKNGYVIDTHRVFVSNINRYINTGGFKFVFPKDASSVVEAFDGGVADMNLLPNNKILLTGKIGTPLGNYVQTNFRINYPSLTLDTTYGNRGMAQYWDGAYIQTPVRTVVLPDGSTYSLSIGFATFPVGRSYAYLIKRKANGMLDSSWQQNGVFMYTYLRGVGVNDMRVAASGNIYLCGGYADSNTTNHAMVMKLLPNGNIDASYGTNGKATATYEGWNLILNADESVYMGCHLSWYENSYIAKIKPNGKPDSSFGTNGIANIPSRPPGAGTTFYAANNMMIQQDGKLVCTGIGSLLNDSMWIAAWRVKPDGKMDSTFGINGIGNYHFPPDSLAPDIQRPIRRSAYCSAFGRDEKILVGGIYLVGATLPSDMFVMRLSNRQTVASSGVKAVSGLPEIGLRVFPVPATNMLHLEYTLTEPDEQLQAIVTDLYGRTVCSKSIGQNVRGKNEAVLDIPHVSAGIYLLQVSGRTAKQVVRVVVQ